LFGLEFSPKDQSRLLLKRCDYVCSDNGESPGTY